MHEVVADHLWKSLPLRWSQLYFTEGKIGSWLNFMLRIC
jgi:hypothetical protein